MADRFLLPLHTYPHAPALVIDAAGNGVADTYGRHDLAALIVKAVNNHGHLLAALKDLVDVLNDDLSGDQCEAWDAALAAIQQAEA